MPEEKKKTLPVKDLDTVVNYMVIKFGYDYSICLPYAEGAKLISFMEKTERVENLYGTNPLKFSNQTAEVTFQIISQKDYREAKLLLLLGVTEKTDG